ncbi:hypothetical protein MHYP_G00257190 [Metynnis hypsauchen]
MKMQAGDRRTLGGSLQTIGDIIPLMSWPRALRHTHGHCSTLTDKGRVETSKFIITESFFKIKSKMKSAVAFVVLACLLMLHVQGQARPSTKRCLCQGSGVNMVRLQRVEKVEVYPPSPSCENVEIIVTLKNGAGQKCLNPESSFAQNYIKRAIKKR